MRTRATEACAIAARMERLGTHTLFRIGVFTLSVAVGYCFPLVVYAVLHRWHSWATTAHDKASPFMDLLRTLHSGFSN